MTANPVMTPPPAASPLVSVVIPTYRRCASLRRTLDALCRQTFPAHAVEVVVVADGRGDDTLEMLRAYDAPYSLQVLEQPGRGAGEKRNIGAAHASGQLLLFLDDDIDVETSCIEAHVRAHDGSDQSVVIGYLPPVLTTQRGLFRAALRAWWEAMFERMRQPGYRFRYTDLLSGNCSVAATLFRSVGGFDPALPVHDDYELGYRLLRAGASFRFAPGAVGRHHDTSDLPRSLNRKRLEGRVGVALGERYPELRRALPLAQNEPRLRSASYALRRLAFDAPAVGERVAQALQSLLWVLELARMRGRWRRLCDHLLAFWYWRGVADAVGSRRALAAYLGEGPTSPETQGDTDITLDLERGLEDAERLLDSVRPSSATIRYGRRLVGHVPPVLGAEPLKGAHLRALLARELAWPLMQVLEEVGVTGLHRIAASQDRALQEGTARYSQDLVVAGCGTNHNSANRRGRVLKE
jgi:GT2 family glycosyltransferase